MFNGLGSRLGFRMKVGWNREMCCGESSPVGAPIKSRRCINRGQISIRWTRPDAVSSPVTLMRRRGFAWCKTVSGLKPGRSLKPVPVAAPAAKCRCHRASANGVRADVAVSRFTILSYKYWIELRKLLKIFMVLGLLERADKGVSAGSFCSLPYQVASAGVFSWSIQFLPSFHSFHTDKSLYSIAGPNHSISSNKSCYAKFH